MTMAAVTGTQVQEALKRVAEALKNNRDHFTALDAALGDGDMGVTMGKVAGALEQHADTVPGEDLGTYLASAGMAVNRAAPSTMGTLVATALMRAGKAVKGSSVLEQGDLAAMLDAANEGVQQRGKAKPGDKTIIDALQPAANAFAQATQQGDALQAAGAKMLEAAEEGLQAVTPKRSRVGRASWVGERTEGKTDPGCAALVVILNAISAID